MKLGTFFKSTTCGAALKGVVVLGVVAIYGCRPAPKQEEVLPISVLRVETTIHSSLVENSVAVTSRRQPGIVFGLNDSGHRPWLFAFDSSGRDRGRWEVVGASNRDWEAASLGPCAASDATESCIYVGDVGDNDARRPYVTIYRIAEPDAGAGSFEKPRPISVLDQLRVRYADHPHDVEAMWINGEGTLYLITKRRLLDAQRKPRPSLIFSVPASAWDSSGVVTASLVDSLPIIPGSAGGRQVNDASLSADGNLLAVRTYTEIFVFVMEPETRLPVSGQTPEPCSIRQLREEQGEGIAWWFDQRRLILTSERERAPFHIVECPLPI